MSATTSRKNSRGRLWRGIGKGSSVKTKTRNHDHVFGD